MQKVHIDNEEDDTWWMPICGVRWAVPEDDAMSQDMCGDACMWLPHYAKDGSLDHPNQVFCKECLNHPDLPMYELKHTELEDP